MANHRASSCGEWDGRGWVETGPQAERGEVKIGEAGAIGTPIGGLGGRERGEVLGWSSLSGGRLNFQRHF